MKAKQSEHMIVGIVRASAVDLRTLVIEYKEDISWPDDNDLTHNILPNIEAFTGILLIEECKYCDLYKCELQDGYRTFLDGYRRMGVEA